MNKSLDKGGNNNGNEDLLECPPDPNGRNFNVNDIEGDVDRDDSGQVIPSKSGRDKKG